MNTQTGRDNRKRLERIWASDREHVRRMLIGLARDIDLADDLLQETYLKALNGMSSCRGDNDRAWLSTIARNLFFGHMRRHYVHAEIAGSDEIEAVNCWSVGTPDHLELIRIREAVSGLGPDLRTALLMKHYCGFTYNEIADNTRCAVGTAKWRVSMAIGKLKEALGVTEEMMEMTCADLGGTRMLDYLYGSLSPDEAEAMDRHLRSCRACRSRLDGTRKILSALDALESEVRVMLIIELDTDGMVTLYGTCRSLNTSDEPINEINFCATKSCNLEYLGGRGEELAFTREENDNPNYPDTYSYHAKLPRPVAPGETFDQVTVSRPSDVHAAVRQDDGDWEFRWGQLTSHEHESALVVAIRLPLGADLLSTEPPPDDTRDNPPTTTLVWRRLLAASEGFVCDIKYRLEDTRRLT